MRPLIRESCSDVATERLILTEGKKYTPRPCWVDISRVNISELVSLPTVSSGWRHVSWGIAASSFSGTLVTHPSQPERPTAWTACTTTGSQHLSVHASRYAGKISKVDPCGCSMRHTEGESAGWPANLAPTDQGSHSFLSPPSTLTAQSDPANPSPMPCLQLQSSNR